MWKVYILKREDGEIYIGVTEDLNRRIYEHSNGGKKFTTRKSGEWSLAYAEVYASKDDAYAREARLKQHGRAKQELLRRIQNSLKPKSGAGRSESFSDDCLPKTQLPANS